MRLEAAGRADNDLSAHRGCGWLAHGPAGKVLSARIASAISSTVAALDRQFRMTASRGDATRLASARWSRERRA